MRMIKTVYLCDHCGLEMEKPIFTLDLETEDCSLQLKKEWHFCRKCWSKVSNYLNDNCHGYNKPKENIFYSPFIAYNGNIVET